MLWRGFICVHCCCNVLLVFVLLVYREKLPCSLTWLHLSVFLLWQQFWTQAVHWLCLIFLPGGFAGMHLSLVTDRNPCFETGAWTRIHPSPSTRISGGEEKQDSATKPYPEAPSWASFAADETPLFKIGITLLGTHLTVTQLRALPAQTPLNVHIGNDRSQYHNFQW